MMAAGTFAARITQSQAAIIDEMSTYYARVSELVRTGKDAGPEGLRLGLVLTFLGDARWTLSRYNAAHDSELTKKHLADERVAERLRLAHELQYIAQVFGWNDLLSAANDVFQEPLQVALLSGWEADTSQKFGELSRQVGGTIAPFRKTSGSRAPSWIGYTYTAYFDLLSAELTTLLAQRGNDFSAGKPILTEALEAWPS